MPLDEWQEYALEAAMGERADGRWVSKFVGISAPRQNGKSQLIVARALAGVLLFGEKMIIISAHETDTARTVWKRLTDLIEDNPSLEARVTGRMDAINREFVSFGTGLEKQTIKLKARRAGGSRGFSADCLLLDEAQILGKQAWGSIVPTMSAMPNPQLWLFGTPPTPEDDAFAFSRVRQSALGKKPRHAWLEWSASPDDDYSDPATWAKSNPSYGVRITHEACADDRAAMDDDQFALERLGMWAKARQVETTIPVTTWANRTSAGPEDGTPPSALAVDMSHDRVLVIAACWRDEDESHVELVAVDHVADPFAALDWLVDKAGRKIPVVLDAYSPAAALLPELKAKKVKTVVVSAGADMARACGGFYDDVIGQRLTHAGQQQLDQAVAGATKRKIGDAGGWGWDRRDAKQNIAPLVATTLARYGAAVVKRRQPTDSTEKKRIVVMS